MNLDCFKKIGKSAVMVAILLVATATAYAAVTPDSLWIRGNQLYALKQYDSALSCYKAIENKGLGSAALYYNMGNAYYRLEQTAASVLYYERALFKDPTNRNIKDNLALAQSRVHLAIAPATPVFFISWWRHLLSAVIPQIWAWLMLLSFIAGLWLLFRMIREKENLLARKRWLSVSAAVFVVTAVLFYFSYQVHTYTNKAVVMVSGTPFYYHQNDGKSNGRLPAGAVVKIKYLDNGWYAVVLPNNADAWIHSNTVEKVQP